VLRIAPLIQPEAPKPKGGRPRVSDRAALTGILFVLKTGIPWEYLPAEMGCGSGMTCWRRLRDWYKAGVWRRLHQVLLEELAQADRINWGRAALDSAAVPAPGRPRNGQEPNGSRQTGHEAPSCGRRPRHPARGPGESRERARFEDDPRHRRRHRAHPRQDARQARRRPHKLHADKVTTTVTSVWPCASAASSPESPAVVSSPRTAWDATAGWSKRTLSWLNRFRHLKIRYEHRADIHLAFLQLGCALISLRFLS
jgi:transposase